MAPFLLVRELLALLVAGTPGRVVNLRSASHRAGEIHWNDLQIEGSYDPLVAYEQSKLALSLLTFELARRIAEDLGVTAVCLDPGNVDTGMLRAGWPELDGIDAATGATTSVYLASSPAVEGISGVYCEGSWNTFVGLQSRPGRPSPSVGRPRADDEHGAEVRH